MTHIHCWTPFALAAVAIAVTGGGCRQPEPVQPRTPATRPVPPAPAPPPVVWQCDFAGADALGNWVCEGADASTAVRDAAGAASVFAPVLAPSQSCRLTLREPLRLAPRHEYRITVGLHLPPYTRRRLVLLLEQAGARHAALTLRPVRHAGDVEPPPVWVEDTAEFVTPGDVTGARIRLEFEAVGADYGVPLAVRGLRIEDLGAVAMRAAPGPNLQANPGVERVTAGGAVIGWDDTVRHADADAAHSGVACARFEGGGRTILGLAGAFITPPVIVELRAWVRGHGRLIPECRRTGAGYLRLQGFRGPEIELSEEWQQVVWEVGIPHSRPDAVSFHFVADMFRRDTTHLDDVEVRILSADGVRHH